MKRCVLTVMTALLTALLTAMVLASGGCGDKQAQPQSLTPRETAAWLASLPVRKVGVGDIEVAYRIAGSGDPLLLLTGFSGTIDNWDPFFVRDLAEGYQVIMSDYRGTGGTTAGTQPPSIPQYAKDTAGLMDALGINRADVLGWSMGTNVAEELVLDYPARVDHLVLYAADAGGSEAIMPSNEVMEQFTDFGGSLMDRAEGMFKLLVPPEWLAEHGDYFLQIFNTDMEIASISAILSQAQAMMDWPGCYDRLPRIASDTLLVTGTEDVLTPPGNSLLMVERIPDARLVQLEGGGHGVMYQYPEVLADVVVEFLTAP